MGSSRTTLRLRALIIATTAMLLTFGALSQLAGSQGPTDHSDLEHHHGFTGPGNAQNWPPRPDHAGGLNSVLNNAAERLPSAAAFGQSIANERSRGLRGAAGADVADDPLAAALGADWAYISFEPARSDKDESTPSQETYFSRTNNQTVIATGTGEVITFAPTSLQPIVSADERTEAAELGRSWLIAQGYPGVESLEGFAIRALDNGEFYPVRMVYVTYATSWFDDPTHSALVDMTNLTVVEGREL